MSMAEAPPRRQSGLFSLARIAGLGLALMLAACSTLVPRHAPPPPVTVKPIPKPVNPNGLPEDVERHRIALLVPLSGPNAAVGQSIADAAAMAGAPAVQ